MTQEQIQFCDDFLRGQRDCEEGKPHQNGSDGYNRGYQAQYELEQANTQLSQIQEA